MYSPHRHESLHVHFEKWGPNASGVIGTFGNGYAHKQAWNLIPKRTLERGENPRGRQLHRDGSMIFLYSDCDNNNFLSCVGAFKFGSPADFTLPLKNTLIAEELVERHPLFSQYEGLVLKTLQ